MIKLLREQFFRIGWLVPTVLPVAQIGGRALVNVIASLYLLWAIAAVLGLSIRVSRVLILLYAAVPLAFLLSLWGAPDFANGFESWFKFTTHVSVFLFTLIALQRVPAGESKLLRSWGVVAFTVVGLLYLILPWYVWQTPFQPAFQLKEDNLPFLLPLGLFYLRSLRSAATRRVLIWLFGAAVLFYIVLSQGRAALLAMAVALLVYGVLSVRWRPWRAAGVTLLVLAVGIALGYSTFFRGMEHAGDVESALDRFSSERTVLWRHALEHPPANVWTGVGIGNLQQQDPILHANGVSVGHLHNFILDVWYETGFLGLAALVLFVGYVLYGVLRSAPVLSQRAQDRSGVVLASIAAILVGGLLSFSYGSMPFDVYMFMLLALLWHISDSEVRADETPDAVRS